MQIGQADLVEMPFRASNGVMYVIAKAGTQPVLIVEAMAAPLPLGPTHTTLVPLMPAEVSRALTVEKLKGVSRKDGTNATLSHTNLFTGALGSSSSAESKVNFKGGQGGFPCYC